MKKTWMLTFTLLISAVRVQSQNPPAAGNPSDHPTEHADTVQGCLRGSVGNFVLTDNLGTTYQILGNASQLGKHIGHEVQITGITSTSTWEADQDSGNRSTNSAQHQIIQLQDVKHVSNTCETREELSALLMLK
jgi:hypothetical protein